MPIERSNPATLPTPEGYVQVVATGCARTIHVAGQVAQRQDGELVGIGDLTAQTEQVLSNVAAAVTLIPVPALSTPGALIEIAVQAAIA